MRQKQETVKKVVQQKVEKPAKKAVTTKKTGKVEKKIVAKPKTAKNTVSKPTTTEQVRQEIREILPPIPPTPVETIVIPATPMSAPITTEPYDTRFNQRFKSEVVEEPVTNLFILDKSGAFMCTFLMIGMCAATFFGAKGRFTGFTKAAVLIVGAALSVAIPVAMYIINFEPEFFGIRWSY